MSTATAVRQAARAARPAPRTVLRPVPLALVTAAPRRAPRAPFVATVLAVLGAGLLGLLALNTVLAQDAFRLHALQVQGRALDLQEQALQQQVADGNAPSALAARAAALGMVPGGPPLFLQLPSGRVLGAAAVPASSPGAPGTAATSATSATTAGSASAPRVPGAPPAHPGLRAATGNRTRPGATPTTASTASTASSPRASTTAAPASRTVGRTRTRTRTPAATPGASH